MFAILFFYVFVLCYRTIKLQKLFPRTGFGSLQNFLGILQKVYAILGNPWLLADLYNLILHLWLPLRRLILALLCLASSLLLLVLCAILRLSKLWYTLAFINLSLSILLGCLTVGWAKDLRKIVLKGVIWGLRLWPVTLVLHINRRTFIFRYLVDHFFECTMAELVR